MKIIDKEGLEIVSPDLSIGRLERIKVFVAHHEAVPGREEQWHYEVTAVYPNGGTDVRKVVDVPGVEAQEAWDEYEDALQYILYTPEELKEIEGNRKPSLEEQVAELKEALELLLSRKTE